MRAGAQVALLVLWVAVASLASTGAAPAASGRTSEPDAALAWHLDYDDAGRLSSLTDPAGRQTRLDYGADDRRQARFLQVTRADGTSVTYTFDARGRRTEMVDPDGAVRYAYDAYGRLISVSRDGMPPISYTYDSGDRITSISVGSELSTRYAYDFLGRLAEVATPAGSIRYEYLTGDNAIRRTLPNGIGTQLDFHPDGKLKTINHFDGGLRIRDQHAYRYRADGRIAGYRHVSDQGEREVAFDYDTVQRLVAVADSRYGRTEYEYDLLGNRLAVRSDGRTAVRSRYDWASRLVEHGGRSVEHDAAGNLTRHPNGLTYTYDAAGRLAGARSEAGEVHYRYDGDGALIGRIAGGEATTFLADPLSDSWRPLAIVRPDGKMTFLVWEGDTPLAEWSPEAARFFLHDHLGTVRAIADTRGAIVERREFGPYGEVLATTTGSGLEPGFAGLFYDADAGVYLTRARGYDPSLGRFLQPDPQVQVATGSQENLSPYNYGRCDPGNCRDGTGRAATCFPDPLWDPDYQRPIGPFLSHELVTEDPTRAVRKSLIKDVLSALAGRLSPEQMNINVDLVFERFEKIEAIYEYRLHAQFHRAHYMEQMHQHISLGFKLQLPFRTYVKNTLKVIKGMDLISNIPSLVDRNQRLAGDPATVAHNLVFGLGALKVLGLPLPIGSVALAKFGVEVGEGIRSRALHDRTLGLVRLPLGEQIRPHVSGRLGSHEGDFKMSSADGRFSAVGGWKHEHNASFSLDDRQRGTLYTGWTHSVLDRYRMASGAMFTGDIRAAQRRFESGDRSYRITDRSMRGRETFSGEGVNRAIQEALVREGRRPGTPRGSPAAGGCTGPGCGPPGWPGGPGGPGERGPGPGPDRFASMTPASVGGVYLGGAGKALAGLGPLAGIAYDKDTKRLVLLAKGEGEIDLPTFSVDDLVAVFRSVYRHGSAPLVSIDPDPDDPEGPWMKVRHGDGTKDTRVGWVLFEADRVMKSYRLGCDNVDRRLIASRVDGYQRLFGTDAPQRDGATWNRFWIVPAEVNRRRSKGGELTLLDVPLRVKSQRMELRRGELVPADDPEPTESARAFAEWFTAAYDEIGREALVAPPGASGDDRSVPVLSELQRIALLSAAAEALRDQGVPLPAWIRSHPVTPVTIPEKTPAIVVTGSAADGRIRCGVSEARGDMAGPGWRSYGGVSLSPEDKVVRTEPSAPAATALAPKVLSAVRAQPVLTAVPVESEAKSYEAVALPGHDFRDVGAVFLAETDLVVPVQRDAAISLVRHFHSFFQPVEELGPGWTFDLPRLEQSLRPARREGDAVEYRVGYTLQSPLGTWSADFSEVRFVAEANGELMVPRDSGPILGLANGHDERVGQPTHDVLFRDGRLWMFGHDGSLIAQSKGPETVVYRRDRAGRLRRIEGWYGQHLRADIKLDYDGEGRLVKATGSNQAEVSYNYDGTGLLSQVIGAGEQADYRYRNGLVVAIARNGEDVRRFEYDPRGRLSSQWDRGADAPTRYEIATGPTGTIVARQDEGAGGVTETAEYDLEMRPLRWSSADGSEIAWMYRDDAIQTRVRTIDGDEHVVTVRNDGADADWLLPDGGRFQMAYDPAGRLIAVRRDDRTILSQEWAPDGRLVSLEDETTVIRPQYAADGVVESLIVASPGAGQRLDRWLEVKIDPLGRPAEVSDHTGGNVRIGYDKTGATAVVASQGQGFEVARDDAGRVQSVRTSWGYQERYTYEKGEIEPKSIEVGASGATAEIEFDRGLPARIREFDGGVWQLTYSNDAEHGDVLAQVDTPAGLTLTYGYRDDGRLNEVTVGDRYRQELVHDAAGRLTRFAVSPPRR